MVLRCSATVRVGACWPVLSRVALSGSWFGRGRALSTVDIVVDLRQRGGRAAAGRADPRLASGQESRRAGIAPAPSTPCQLAECDRSAGPGAIADRDPNRVGWSAGARICREACGSTAVRRWRTVVGCCAMGRSAGAGSEEVAHFAVEQLGCLHRTDVADTGQDDQSGLGYCVM